MKIIRIGIIATLLTFLTACSTQTFLVNGNYPLPDGFAAYEGRSNFFIMGIGQTTFNQVGQYCGGKQNIHSVETTISPVDVLIGLFTFPFYTPQTFRVYCMPGSR